MKIKDQKLEKKVLFLAKQGFTLREIGRIVEKSHEWVRKVIHKTGIDKKPETN